MEFYNSVFDIDSYIGIFLEREPKNSYVSPTAACLTNEQFDRYIKGDRYYYLHPQNPHPFTKGI